MSNSNDNYFVKIVQDENTHKYGLFNENDKQQVLACDYDTIIHNRASYFNFFYIRKNNLWGVTDSLGQVTVDCSLDSVRTSSNRVDFVLISYAGNKRGVLDNHGYVILPCEFTHVLWKYDMRDHIASMDQPGNYVGNIVPAVKNENGRWELYNRKGERINQSLYIDVQQTCHPDLVKVKDKSLSGYGLIDINGNEILPCKYNVIYNFCNDRTWIRVGRARKSLNDDLADDKWMCIDSQGKVVFSYPGNYTVYPYSHGLAAVVNNDVTKIDSNSLVGFCDVDGNMTIPMVFNLRMTETGGWYHPTFTEGDNSRAWVSFNGKDGYLTTDGQFHED